MGRGSLETLRQTVYGRCKGYCEACGGVLPPSWALHHRKLRSRGGKDTLSNLVALHHECHNLGRPSAHLDPEWATSRGLICPSWEEPKSYVLTLPSGARVFLLDDGSYLPKKDD